MTIVVLLSTISLVLFNSVLVLTEDCGSQLDGKYRYATFYSPKHPDTYFPSTSMSCQYTITSLDHKNLVVVTKKDIVNTSVNVKIYGNQMKELYYEISDEHPARFEYYIPDTIAVVDFMVKNINLGTKFAFGYYTTQPMVSSRRYNATDSWKYITSSNYPKPYTLNKITIYTINSEDQISSLVFKVETCDIDKMASVKVYSGIYLYSQNLVLQGKCPLALPYEFNVTSIKSIIVFNPGTSNAKTGFKLGYKMYSETIPTTTLAPTTATQSSTTTLVTKSSTTPPLSTSASPSENDTFHATEFPGYIYSPNYPNNYPINQTKIYIIVAKNQRSILMFQIDECDLDPNYHFITVYKGEFINQSELVFNGSCPKYLPYSFNVYANKALVVFSCSDYGPPRSGFKIRFATLQKPTCPLPTWLVIYSIILYISLLGCLIVSIVIKKKEIDVKREKNNNINEIINQVFIDSVMTDDA